MEGTFLMNSMKRKNLIALMLLLFCFSGAVAAQGRLSQLRSWAGRYPTHKTGRITRNFFQLPEIRRPLLALLSRKDFNLLTREYGVETPIKQIGDFLAVKVCRPHACDTDQAGFAINLRTGFVYVRMQEGQTVRWFSSRDTYMELPQSVQEYLTDFSAT
jgi:hypothetical protein